MAGGSGTRLYPRSRENAPKQFQKIIGEKTLIEQSFDRVTKIIRPDNIYISSNHKYQELINRFLPNIPNSNYITEPVKRNTGPAMALASAIIAKKDPEAIIISTHSDHLVLKTDEYVKVIVAGVRAIENDTSQIVTIGIVPTSPHTGYGYIEKAGLYKEINGFIAYKAKRFVEKPDSKTAKAYIESGNFLWNAGYFIWQAKHFLNELKKYNPKMYNGIKRIVDSSGKNNYREVLDKEFRNFEDVAIDYLIMEKTKNLLVIPADLGWSDIGSWDVVANMIERDKKDENENFTEGLVLIEDTYNSMVLNSNNKKLIATVGIDNLIIVATEDATVIVPRGRSEEIKKIIDKLKKNKLDSYI